MAQRKINRDTTARRERRAPSVAPAAIGTLALLGHELRTPLVGITGLAGLLLDTALTAEQRNYVRMLKASGETMLGLVEAALAPRLPSDAGLAPAVFDPAALVVETVELLSLRARERGLELAVVTAPDVPDRVVGAPEAVRQILTNLLANAIKFTERGGAIVRLACGAGTELRLEVSDTGPGVAPRDRPRIFRPHVRGTSEGEGQGLGLSIVAALVEAAGGTLSLADAPAGARFVVTLPLQGADGPSAPAPDSVLAGARIVILSGSPVLREALREQLLGWNARAEAVRSARTLPAALRRDATAAVLIDLALGDKAVEAGLRASRARGAQPIALVAPAQRARLDALRALGFAGYLVKPVRPRSLASRLAAPAWHDEPQPPAGSAHDSLSVLIVEDDDVHALLLAARLARLGHAPLRARDGTAALAAFARHERFDLVLLDLHLPGTDGPGVAAQLRALDGGKALPIIAMTASSAALGAAGRAAAEAAGIDALLAKPIDPARLDEVLRDATEARGGR